MVKFAACWVAGAVLLVVGCSEAQPTAARTVDLKHHFSGCDGCFVMLDIRRGLMTRYNPERCRRRFSPCSTFKIASSLIGLETGVLKGADHVFTWDGVQRGLPSWNRDHDLRSAIRHSVVWYYQRLASQVGEGRMLAALAGLDYGNQDISGGLTQFWLGSSLTISANEQVEVLRRLALGELPLSERSQRIVNSITILPEDNLGVLRGKTGSQWKGGKYTLGWFVGYLVSPGGTYVFATNISDFDQAHGAKAREITLSILDELETN